MESLIALTALATAAFMAGVLWLVQIVHYPLLGADSGRFEPTYPLLGAVPNEDVQTIALRHQTLITRVVGPAMIVEAAASAMLLFVGPMTSRSLSIVGFLLLGIAVAVTIFQAVPLHARIAQGKAYLIPQLIRINWTRTIAWTLRIPVGALVVHQSLS